MYPVIKLSTQKQNKNKMKNTKVQTSWTVDISLNILALVLSGNKMFHIIVVLYFST